MTEIGATREGRVAPVYQPRDHYTTRGRPKRQMTLDQAQAMCDAYNAGQTDHRYRTGHLTPYHCRVCDQYHTGHLREACPNPARL